MNSRHGVSTNQHESFWESEWYLVLTMLFFVTGSLKIIIGVITFNNNETLSYILVVAGIIAYGFSVAWFGVYKDWWT